MAMCAAACVLLWPHAREAYAILAAQDDPAELADLQLNSALRNNETVINENIETALAAGDADLAGSFADLAREKSIALDEDLSRRVTDAVAEQNSSSHFAKGFASGLVTGNADDVAFRAGSRMLFQIAVFNRNSDENKSISEPLALDLGALR